MRHDSPAEINRLLEAKGLALKKRFGQNFLVNRSAREKILQCLAPAAGEMIWEIGPGLGAMTEMLLDRGARVIVFEIDGGFVRVLKEFYGGRSGFEIVEGDAVKNLASVKGTYGVPDRVLGNLPYSSASQIIAGFIDAGITARRITITVQKELALRLGAAPRHKNYSSFSVLCQSFFDVRHEFDLKGGSFHPRPEVDSSVVSLTPSFRLVPGAARDAFFKLIRLAFGSRRKTLSNNLLRAARLSEAEKDRLRRLFARMGLNPNVRAEELAPGIFQAMAEELADGSTGSP